MWNKVKIRKADKLFSDYIRERANWKCEACGKDYSENKRGLHCSHYYGRGRENVRFEPDNAAALCFYHHRSWGHGDGRDEYKSFMIRKLGQGRFDGLTVQANTFRKKDDVMALLQIKALMKEVVDAGD